MSKPGFTSVERVVNVKSEKDSVAVDARLTSINTTQNLIDGNGGTIKIGVQSSQFRVQSTGSSNSEPGTLNIELTIPANAVAEQTDIRLTPISNQGLANLLPGGWSPIAAVEVDALTLNSELGTLNFSSEAVLKIPAGLVFQGSSQVAFVKYDVSSHQWFLQNPGTVSSDGAFVTASVSSTGQYAVVLPDDVTCTASAASALTPCSSALYSELSTLNSITATGKVVPAAAPAAIGLKAIGEVAVSTTTSRVRSGGIITGKVTERFDLLSGEVVLPSDYVLDLVLYRYPCITNLTLNSELSTQNSGKVGTSFPVTPSREYTIVDLMKGKVGIEIALKQGAEASGTIVGAEGARLLDKDGNVLVINQNSLAKTVPVETQTIPASTLTGIVGPDFTLLRAVDVNLSNQTLAGSAELSIPAPANVSASLPIVVARAIEIRGVKKLKLVSLAKLSGSIITSSSGLPVAASPSLGITVSGQYFFLQAKSLLGFVSGTVKDGASKAYPSAQVVTSTSSLTDLTGADGKYLVAATVAGFTLSASDIYKNDKGTRIDQLSTANEAKTLDVTINVTPPSVVAVSPENNAVNVDPKTQIVITMSEAVKPETVTTNTITLEDATGTKVQGVFSLNPDGTIITFYPSVLLNSETLYSLTVTHSVQDLQGYFMGQDYVSHFTIKDTTPPVPPAAGSIVASFPDADGYVTITATQGSAEATGTVLIINDTSGEIVSVKPNSNGSFTAKIMAQLGNEIKILSMDASGNQTVITYITFKSSDGRYMVTAKGGTVSEESSGAKLDIPDGTLLGPTIVKITSVTESQLPQDNPIPNGAKFLGAVNIDSNGALFGKEVHLSIPVPSSLPSGAVPFVAQPQTLTNADGTQEKVYVIVDSAKVLNGRLMTASPPFDGITTPGLFVFTFMPAPLNGSVVISGYTYRDMDGNPGYLPQTDIPIRNAVIRSPGADNFVAYSNSDGHYASYAFTSTDVCRSFATTAIHPQTMNRVTSNLTTCDVPYIVNNFNFRLADRNTQLPDTTAPSITMNMQVVPGQQGDPRFVAGTVPINTDIRVPITIIDQEMGTASLSVRYSTPDVNSPYSATLAQGSPVIHSYITPDNPVAIYQYSYQTGFNFPIAGSESGSFKPSNPGTYTFTVEATDAAGNRSSRTVTVRAIQPGTQLDGVDGPPQVDEIVPSDGAQEVMVTMPVMITFNEPVKSETVSSDSFQLFDRGEVNPSTGFLSTPIYLQVPAAIVTSLEGGRVKATLQPKNNLKFGHQYEIVLKQTITDAIGNSSTVCGAQTPPQDAGCLLGLNREYRTTFTTKIPQVYDLDEGQFTGGRGIDLYTALGKTYAYITAGTEGWYVVDVTDPTSPTVVKSQKLTNPGVLWSDRGVAVDPVAGILAITEDIEYLDGNQYGYVRFYDISNSPAEPQLIAREKLTEAFSGMPGRVSVLNNFAYIATVQVGVQVVDSNAAKTFMQTGQLADGSTIVGVYDTIGQGYRNPTDIIAYKGGKAALTTTDGHLVLLDINMPSVPTEITAFKPTPGPHNYNFDSAWRVAVSPDYAFTELGAAGQDPNLIDPGSVAMNNSTVIDLAVTVSMQGRIHTVNITDPYNIDVMGVTKDSDGNEVMALATDITISKGSGLVYITSGMSVYIVDIKDPYNPKLLNIVTTTPIEPGSATMSALGASTALVEKDGWVYLASSQKGLRVLDLDPVYLKQYCDDAEFVGPDGKATVSPNFCYEYYPALGKKIILLQGFNANGQPFQDSDKAKVRLLESNTPLDVQPVAGYECNEPDATANAKCAVFKFDALSKSSIAKFQIGTSSSSPGNAITTTFKIDDPHEPTNLIAEYGNIVAKAEIRLKVRRNSNVSFDEVLAGTAVYVNECTSNLDDCSTGNVDINGQKGFYYVQELLNQVVPRKRTLANPFNSDYAFSLIDQNGKFDKDTYNAFVMFKRNFMANVNYNVGSYNPTEVPRYSATDNTSDIFRKLMKDYGKRKNANPWLGGALLTFDSDINWKNRIIDKNILIGNEEKDSDNVVNGNIIPGTSETARDTGLYELFKNVIEQYVDKMIDQARLYAGERQPDFAQSEQAVTDNWYSRDGKGPGQHGTVGMSYSYYGKMNIDQFNTGVSDICWQPNETKFYGVYIDGTGQERRIGLADPAIPYHTGIDPITLMPIPALPGSNANPTKVNINYKGNLADDCSLGSGESRKYAGLMKYEFESTKQKTLVGYADSDDEDESETQYFDILHTSLRSFILEQYMQDYWAGTDCSGLAQHSVNSADSIQIPGASSAIPQLGNSGSFMQYARDAKSSSQLIDEYTYIVSMDPANVAIVKKIRKGDLLNYDEPHVSIVHSDPTCTGSVCSYEIIHASGNTHICYLAGRGQRDTCTFNRKVVVNSINHRLRSTTLKSPTRFGRLMLWD